MEETVSIEMLRLRFREARWHRIGEQVMAYIRLIRHPDVCWIDLLEALDQPGLISDDAAMVLQQRLVTHFDGRPPKDRVFWEGVLNQRQLGFESACAGYHPAVVPSPHLSAFGASELDVGSISDLSMIDVPAAPARPEPDISHIG